MGTVAGVTGAVTIEHDGLRREFVFTTVPAKVIDHIVVKPSGVTLTPGERADQAGRRLPRIDSKRSEAVLN